MVLDLKKEIGPNSSVTLVIPNETYIKTISTVAKQLSDSYGKICYVSLNKLYMALTRSMKASEVDINKFFFIK